MTIRVYTDGSCSKNGKKNSLGGIGIYFAENDPRNYSESLASFYIREFGSLARDTNNLAELCAILRALQIVEEQLKSGERVIVITDSNYSINCLTTWYPNWQANSWKNSKNKPVTNREVIQKILDDYVLKYPGKIAFKHVKAHTNLNDSDSVGNARADELARHFVFE